MEANTETYIQLPLVVYEDRSSTHAPSTNAGPDQNVKRNSRAAGRGRQATHREDTAVGAVEGTLVRGMHASHRAADQQQKHVPDVLHAATRVAVQAAPSGSLPHQQPFSTVTAPHQCNIDRGQRGHQPIVGGPVKRKRSQYQHTHPYAGGGQEKAVGTSWWNSGSCGAGHAEDLHREELQGNAGPFRTFPDTPVAHPRLRKKRGSAAAQYSSEQAQEWGGMEQVGPAPERPLHGQGQQPVFHEGVSTRSMQASLQGDAFPMAPQWFTNLNEAPFQQRPPGLQAAWCAADTGPQLPGVARHSAGSSIFRDRADITVGQQQSGHHRGSLQLHGNVMLRLHQEVEAFSCRAAPTDVEQEAVEAAAQVVRESATELWPECTVGLFGSQASSLALPGSDIDITVLGIPNLPISEAAGVSKKKRNSVMTELRKLLGLLKKRGLVIGKAETIPARVPIIKCYLAVGPGRSIAADISLGVGNGPLAVPFILQQVDRFGPCLRSLTLVMKALLKQARLNDRATGGLGSYCLLNLVMAHLAAEGVRADSPVNLGELLMSLLRRFGKDFNYTKQAVSIREGGFMAKLKEWRHKKRAHLLAVEDAQQPGRDIGAGAFNILEVKRCLGDAYDALHMRCTAAVLDESSVAQPSWAAVQAEGQSRSTDQGCSTGFPLLGSIINPGLALDRNPAASQARMDLSKPVVLPKLTRKAKKMGIMLNKRVRTAARMAAPEAAHAGHAFLKQQHPHAWKATKARVKAERRRKVPQAAPPGKRKKGEPSNRARKRQRLNKVAEA